MKEAIETLGPLIDRIISNPLSFTTTRKQTLTVDEKPASYIVLSKSKSKKQAASSSSQVSSTALEDLPTTDPEQSMKRPRSMYEAVQAYTGKRFMTKAEKRAEKRAEKLEKVAAQSLTIAQTNRGSSPDDDDDNDEDLGEDLALDGQSSVSEYESASEFPSTEEAASNEESESSSSSYKKESDDESENRQGLEIDDTKFANGITLSDEIVDEDDEDEEDDDDYDVNQPEDSVSEAEESSSLGEEGSDDSDKHNDSASPETSSPESDTVSKPASVIKTTQGQGGQEGTSTPPTSPEQEITKAALNKSFKKDVVPLADFYQINEYDEDRGSNHSTRIYKNWRELAGQKPLGLLNHGVTCYMNSAIQAMIHIPAMQHYLNDIHEGVYSNVLKPRSVSMVLSELSRKMWGLDGEKKPPSFVNPKRIIQRLEDINCMMSEWQQEDAHEYYMSLMSRLQEDLTPKGKKLNLSIIYDIFGGLLHQAVTCKNCGHISNTKQEFYDLSLGLNRKKKSQADNLAKNHLKYSIEKSIHDFFSSELIKHDKSDTSSGYECEECKQRTNATKISTIDRAPETLTVHLKRFKFNGNSSSKMKQLVEYPQYLDLTQYSSDKSPVKYELTSVIVHEGRLLLSGHYVAHCLQSDGSWANYDDEYINKVGDREALSDPSAYFLIYSRLTHRGIKRKSEDSNPLPKKRRH